MLLSVNHVRKEFGSEVVLHDVTFRIGAKEKVGLVGRNGSGKTTLIRLLTGEYEPDGGSLQLARGAKIGYLKQEEAVSANRTVLEEAQAARQHVLELEQRLKELEAILESNPTDEDLEEYALLHEHFMEAEGYSAARDVRQVLARMGFNEEDFDKPAAKLSGGEKTRLALARLLLEEPDLLILDEPTNHLDLEATEWLERWLIAYPGAVLVVSHDRTFLEAVPQRFIDMSQGRAFEYPGPYAKFIQTRQERAEYQAEMAKRQSQEIAKLDEFVRRFMNSQRTAQARGRLKMKERLEADRIEAPNQTKGMAASVKAATRSGDNVLVCDKLGMAFGANTLFSNLNWTVRRGERWGIIGANGAGKSTLIKAALGKLPITEGRATLGANVEIGYFAQDVAELNLDQTPLDFMVYEVGMLPPEARTLLGRYLFFGDDVFRPIRTFSGGEKNKLALARLTYLQPNLLILDEPTNHLDMESREALAGNLKEYSGTLILISHDRWLLQEVSSHTLDLQRDKVTQFPGGYQEYRRFQHGKLPVQQAQPKNTALPKSVHLDEDDPIQGLSHREIGKEIQRVQKWIGEIETQISATEAEIAAAESVLASPPKDADLIALTTGHQTLQEKLMAQMAKWEKESGYLERLQATRPATKF